MRIDRLHAMTVFVRVVETGSFTRAAELLGLSRASVTITVQQLEAYLKVRLLQRTTRQLRLTPDGAGYFERCVRILTDVDEAEGAFDIRALVPRGRLRIDMPAALGRAIVMPRIHEFCAQYPDIELAIGFGDRLVDMIQEGIDCVIRVGELQDSSLVAKKVGTYQQITAASPLYIKRNGLPKTINDLEQHYAANYFFNSTGKVAALNFLVEGRLEEKFMKGDVAVNDVEAHLQSGLDGMGIIQAARFLTLPYLQSGRLREVLPHHPAPAMPISVVYPTGRHLSLTVRVFVDWAAELFHDNRLLTAVTTVTPQRTLVPHRSNNITLSESTVVSSYPVAFGHSPGNEPSLAIA